VEKLDTVRTATNRLVDLSMNSVFVHILNFIAPHLLTVLTQKNAVDLQNVGVQSLNTHHGGQGENYISHQKHWPLSMHDFLSTGHH